MKIALSLFFMIASFGMGILIMTEGWGLHPQSWGWIIGGSITVIVFTMTCAALNE